MSVYDMPRLNNFSAVAKHYAKIKPVISKRHTREQDVRPLGDRNRKWERVQKLSDDCYAFYDGDIGDPIAYSDYHRNGEGITLEASEALAPVMWTREKGGWNREILRVRNGSGSGAHNGRYSFLERALPSGFAFVVDNGKQFVMMNGTRYFLPKSNYYAWGWRTDKDAVHTDDFKYLEFERSPGEDWKIKTNSFTYVPPRVLVDKERKKKFKPAMDSYYSWLCVMAPMFRYNLEDFPYDYEDKTVQARDQAKHKLAREKTEELFDYAKEQGWTDADYIYGFEMKGDHALIIMEDEEHPMRMNMAWPMLMDSPLFKAHESDRKLFRAHYNRWINKVCGFNKKIDAQVITTEEK
ncbi:hypothetical protein N9869_01025 [Algibacter sp.]|nr:hypothetical protein [Algibacter sp.]MDB4273883.1 hypothetical protein [Algibacter sp.]